MNALKGIILTAAVALAPATAFADFRHCESPVIGYRGYTRPNYENSAYRYGVRSGQLSPREARELAGERVQLQQKQAYFASDGWISNRERQELRNDRREYDRDLHHELNDGERRW